MKKEEYVDVSANMYHFDEWIDMTNPIALKNKFERILEQADFTIVNFTEHYFPVEGYTCIWLLAESHLAIHTFPKKNQSYIQLSSCNKVKKDVFVNLIHNF